MVVMIIGLVLFLGMHSIRIFADDWRTRKIARVGNNIWMGIYSLIALTGFVLIIIGYGQARMEPVVVWEPSYWTRYITVVLTLPAFILLVATYIPGTNIKRMVGHPMLLGVKVWALAHLFSNGMLADLILFGSFLLWSVLDYRTSRRRDRLAGTVYSSTGVKNDILSMIIGILAWVLFAAVLHRWLIGVDPL